MNLFHLKNNKNNNGILPKPKTWDFECVSCTAEVILEKFKTAKSGLTEHEARKRLEQYGYNEPTRKGERNILIQILSRFLNPLVVVLIIIAAFSFFLGGKDGKISAVIVFAMAALSVLLSFIQEHRAGKEVEKLSEMVRTTATVYRNGNPREVKIKELVPGDIVDLFAGDMIPADLRIIFCKDLFINEASLTGESFPVEKVSTPVAPKKYAISELTNIAFMGSSVVSGTALGLVMKTGVSTQFGEISKKISEMRAETSFEKGIKGFTMLMIHAMIFMVIFIFAVNALRRGDLLQSFLFSLGVAVGLTPEMLPMIVTINLSKGAIAMSKKEVIVKRLSSIQNFGAMDTLCTDKTGTLTMNKIVLEKHCDVVGRENEDVLRYAYINSFYQTGLKDLLDKAILKHEKILVKQFKKIDEVPFDFSRRIMSVVVDTDGRRLMIAKGAPEEIFKRCTHYELDEKIFEINKRIISDLKKEYDSLSMEGFRVLAIAYKDVHHEEETFSIDDEKDLTLKGYVAFLDPPKPTAKQTIGELEKLGIEFKILTGDNDLVTKKICNDVGLNVEGLITGEEMENLNDEEIREMVKKTNVFARLSPLQKTIIIKALRDNNHIVGYLGDGINDAPALKSSDVGISVNNAADIAKESADIILLQKSLMVLKDGVIEGRKIFGNILKYVKMGSSSNFGNMLSMTGGSMFLPFLPMLPIQILLNNFLYDISQTALPTDEVDSEYITRARPWNVDYIKKFMVIIGPISSLYDFLTWGIMFMMFFIFANIKDLSQLAILFHTGWFIESLCTQTLVIYIIRTGKIPFIESRPSKPLIFTSMLIVGIAIAITFSPFASAFGFVALPALYFLILFFIVITYLLLVQLVKSWFIKRYGYE